MHVLLSRARGMGVILMVVLLLTRYFGVNIHLRGLRVAPLSRVHIIDMGLIGRRRGMVGHRMTVMCWHKLRCGRVRRLRGRASTVLVERLGMIILLCRDHGTLEWLSVVRHTWIDFHAVSRRRQRRRQWATLLRE